VDAKLKEMISANLNRSENKPGHQNPKEQTNYSFIFLVMFRLVS
jgi:hypothetical protein